jgi:hypothetical protein
MKKAYIIVSAFLLFVFMMASAQDGGGYGDKTMCFVYIAQSDSTPSVALEKYLDARFTRALKDESLVLVIYYAGGTNPLIVQVNTSEDNRGDYELLLDELKRGDFRRVDSSFDVRNIAGLFDKLDFVAPASNVLKYGAVDWHFHVTSDFWEQGYNESLIASLCFVMGVDHFENANFRLRCYFSRYDDLEYDEDYPFGKKDYCNLEFRPYYY